jgi:hypothetical protein
MNLVKDRFVPYAPRWGSTGYASQDRWLHETLLRGRANVTRIRGTQWEIFTANGTLVVSSNATLEGALEAFAKLPEKDRKPVVEPRGTYDPKLEAADQPARPDTVFVNVYCRPLALGTDDKLRPADGLDMSEFGGGGRRDFSEPQRDSLWLTAAEAQSLMPKKPQQGQSFAVPSAIRQRIFLFYLYNWFANSGGGYWGPKHLKSGNLTLTVEEATDELVRLRLKGQALVQFKNKTGSYIPHGHLFYVDARESKQVGLPDVYDVSYDAQLFGVLEYQPAKRKLTRFDAVALGDYKGHWVHWLKVKPVPLGFAFQLDTRELDLETGRHAPFGLSRAKGNYWAPDMWKGD